MWCQIRFHQNAEKLAWRTMSFFNLCLHNDRFQSGCNRRHVLPSIRQSPQESKFDRLRSTRNLNVQVEREKVAKAAIRDSIISGQLKMTVFYGFLHTTTCSRQSSPICNLASSTYSISQSIYWHVDHLRLMWLCSRLSFLSDTYLDNDHSLVYLAYKRTKNVMAHLLL